MNNKLFLLLLLTSTSAFAASGEDLKEELVGYFYWIAGVGFFISAGTIAAAKVWPDSFIEPLAKRYSTQLGWAVFAFIAFLVFKSDIATFFTWLANPTDGIL